MIVTSEMSWQFLERLLQLCRHLPQPHVVVAAAPQRQGHDRHVVDRARLDERAPTRRAGCGRVGRQLLVEPDERALLVLADEEADDHHRAAGARGRVDVLDAGHLPEQLLDRARDALLDLGRRRARHVDEHVDHRHDDLRLLLARQRDHRVARRAAARRR